ncbi:MAG: hypothetical protein LBC02_11220 [Planctomycetaceae bacterium]|nr:hypothetical protein [Planctomycetaceae bacterium]
MGIIQRYILTCNASLSLSEKEPIFAIVSLLSKSDILLPFLGLVFFPLYDKTDYMLHNLLKCTIFS